MTEIEKIKKSLDIVFDYVNNQNNGVVQTKAINELENAINKVENLSICSVVNCCDNRSTYAQRFEDVM